MARPKKQQEDRRTESLAFRLTPAERMDIERAAAAAGLSASEYARMQTLKGRVVIRQGATLDPALFAELKRLGVNLNQLTRTANQTGSLPAELASVCTALETILVRELDHGA